MSETVSGPIDPLLLESEARYRAVIENASDMIQSVRPDGTFEFVNAAWLRQLGYTADEVERLIVWDIIHPDQLNHCQGIFSVVMLKGEGVDDFQTTFITKDGRSIPVEGSVTVRMLGDEVIATHGFFRDISERLRARELEERNAQLEREQHARYLEKMAALGKLSAGLAHELNNPAAAAQRASSQLSENLAQLESSVQELTSRQVESVRWKPFGGLLDDLRVRAGEATLSPLEIAEREEAIETWLDEHAINDAWNLSSTLVQAGITVDLLQPLVEQIPAPMLPPMIHCIVETMVARDLSGVIALSTRRISELVTAVKAYTYMDQMPEQIADVHDGIENTLVILAHRLKNVMVRREFDRSLPKIHTVGSQLNQVWTNMLDNAVDALGDGGTITIRTGRSADRLMVEIQDDGAGIPPEILERIFEPFFTTKPQGQGTGLGLDTVWRIVTEQHGGTIEVESVPGNTVFRVLLPLDGAPAIPLAE